MHQFDLKIIFTVARTSKSNQGYLRKVSDAYYVVRLYYVKKPRPSQMSLMCLVASLSLKRLSQLGSRERDL